MTQPILSEVKRCYGGTKRSAGIHITPGVAMGSSKGVVTEVDAIIEADHERVRVSRALVSMGSYVEHNISITISQ